MKKSNTGILLLAACILVYGLLTALLFDVKVSDGGDDSSYVQSAYYFLKAGTLPGYQGPLYPVALSAVMLFSGMHLVILKLSSVLFLLLFFIVFYNTYKDVAGRAVLLLLLLCCIVNAHFLYYGYHLYSEAFFMLLMAVTIRFFNRHFIATEPVFAQYLLLSVLLLACFLARTAGIFCLMAVFLYFLSYRKWKNMGIYLLVTVAIFGAYFMLKKIIWPDTKNLHFSTQLASLLQKDFYNQASGYEDVTGMLRRLLDNGKQYLSYHFANITGFLPDTAARPGYFATLLWYIVYGYTMWYFFRCNRLLYFTGLMVISGCLVSFLALQVSWDQERIILVYVPFMLILLAALLEQWRTGAVAACILLGISASINLKKTIGKIEEHQPEMTENLSGNLLYGYTPDLANYLEAAKWCGANRSKDSVYACRKPSIAFIFSPAPNFGIFNVPAVTGKVLTDSCSSAAYTPVLLDISRAQGNAAYAVFLEGAAPFMYAVASFNDTGNNERIGLLCRFPVAMTAAFLEQARTAAMPVYTGVPVIQGLLANGGYQIDELRNNLQEHRVSHMIMASLRVDPNRNTGYIITTLHRYAFYLSLKYPRMFTLVKTIGNTEPAMIYQIRYPQD
ncbi:Alg9-like mannosyltransferase family protein [Chitinophaga terrae (ex Kim and Jung 2007)]|uniref:Alg9-like mannosyltransferase family protein n=1 Tax=Chitinophaga terrae (ex Kim and Jung 2007) TaxID=408074 RepID=A0A1H3ZHG8_9BACT|nr:hypothetical protein [Chitinophaga terrae (ex Kim and Jung 2007)]GEP88753.1 hypothetical protein CTE07_03980 [Chitinophaga terrae (ex Kim and Jung 2007)]SEA23105.1 Alg9-like mannosyltransferase family protein [Chitinophaga terrae (ex Kim and Jung 2007)]